MKKVLALFAVLRRAAQRERERTVHVLRGTVIRRQAQNWVISAIRGIRQETV